MEHDERDGITYAIQYFCNEISEYLIYQEKFAPKLQEEHTDKYKDKFVAFRTILKEVN